MVPETYILSFGQNLVSDSRDIVKIKFCGGSGWWMQSQFCIKSNLDFELKLGSSFDNFSWNKVALGWGQPQQLKLVLNPPKNVGPQKFLTHKEFR